MLPNGIPDKGRVLTGLSVYWFDLLKVPNHLIATEVDAAGLELTQAELEALAGRSMVVRKARVVPFECVVRGYLSGSAWKEYRASGTVCGIPLPPGLVESQAIEPIFTPATKAETGHDENVSFEFMARSVGKEVAETLQSMSLEVYRIAAQHAAGRGLILADTKFEWGFDEQTGELLLVDEVLTPDSSRYWSKQSYRPGGPQPSFDKQFVRDWLETTAGTSRARLRGCPSRSWTKTRGKYIEAYELLTGSAFPGSERAAAHLTAASAFVGSTDTLGRSSSVNMLRYLTAGESHGPALTAIVEGFPSGITLDTRPIDRELERRQGGYGRGKRQQLETDRIIVESGVFHGVTTGSPLTLRLLNNDAKLERLTEPAAPRGGHIDLAGAINYQTGIRQVLERASARETALRVAAGAVAKLLLARARNHGLRLRARAGRNLGPADFVRPGDSRRQPGLHLEPRRSIRRSSPRSTPPAMPATPWAASSRRSSPAARSVWEATPSGTASSTPGWPAPS